MKKIQDHVKAIRLLREHGLNGVGIIRAYHQGWVAPLMVRALALHRMALGVSLEGMVLTEAPVDPTEITRCIRDMMGSQGGSIGATPDYVFPAPGCPPMHLEPGFVEFVSPCFSRLPFFYPFNQL